MFLKIVEKALHDGKLGYNVGTECYKKGELYGETAYLFENIS